MKQLNGKYDETIDRSVCAGRGGFNRNTAGVSDECSGAVWKAGEGQDD